MVLQHDWTWRAGLAREDGAGVVLGDFHIILNLDAVLVDRDASRFHLLAVLANRGSELNVIALPHRRRLADILERSGHLVDRAAIIVLALQSVAIENLHLVTALDVDAAIAAFLALLVRAIRHAELNVQLEMAVELLLG